MVPVLVLDLTTSLQCDVGLLALHWWLGAMVTSGLLQRYLVTYQNFRHEQEGRGGGSPRTHQGAKKAHFLRKAAITPP